MEQNELLDFARNFFEEMRIHTRLIDAPYPWDDAFDLNLRHTLLKYDEDVASTFFQPEEHFHEKHLVYFIKDLFWCHYLCIPVPNAGQKRVLFIGPFATEDATLGLVRSLTEQLQIPDTHFSFLSQYHTSLPVLRDKSCMRSMLICLCNRLYDGPYRILTQEWKGTPPLSYDTIDSLGQNHEVSKSIEQRYQGEQNLMEAISRGDYAAAKECLNQMDSYGLEQRLADTIRDKKNYLIIFNTLCRKAAQYGRVHPVYLDELSSRFAIQLETMHNMSRLNAIQGEMVYKYSLLVQNRSTRSYSPLIQKAVDFICLNFKDDLSLSALSDQLSVHKSYLSTLFKRETGTTLTDFVTDRRISHAIYLLNTTSEPVQEIASACGIPDLSYFTKIFRRKKGMTPTQYREMIKQPF